MTYMDDVQIELASVGRRKLACKLVVLYLGVFRKELPE